MKALSLFARNSGVALRISDLKKAPSLWQHHRWVLKQNAKCGTRISLLFAWAVLWRAKSSPPHWQSEVFGMPAAQQRLKQGIHVSCIAEIWKPKGMCSWSTFPWSVSFCEETMLYRLLGSWSCKGSQNIRSWKEATRIRSPTLKGMAHIRPIMSTML